MFNFFQLVVLLFYFFQVQTFHKNSRELHRSQIAFPDDKVKILIPYKRMLRRAMNDMNTKFSFDKGKSEGLTIFGIKSFKFIPEQYVNNHKPDDNYFDQNSSGIFNLYGIEKIFFTQGDSNQRNIVNV